MGQEKVTRVGGKVGIELENAPVAVTQAAIEVGIHDPADLHKTQAVVEVERKFYTSLRASQILIEVIRKRVPRYYTDGAAGCNFTY